MDYVNFMIQLSATPEVEEHLIAKPAEPPHVRQDDAFLRELTESGRGLGPAARRVIDFVDRNRATALASSAQEIAAGAATSDATVVRTVQALGFAGLNAFKQALAEAVERPSSPADAMRLTLAEIRESASTAFDMVVQAHDEAMLVLRSADTRAQIAAAVGVLHPSERIAVFGIGPSGALARYAAVLFGRNGRRVLLLDQTGIQLADQMLELRAGDAVLILAYTRPYREVSALLVEARRLGLPVVLFTDSLTGRLARFADVVLAIPRGRTAQVALHGATLVALEALILALAVNDGSRATLTLDRLNALRASITGQPSDLT